MNEFLKLARRFGIPQRPDPSVLSRRCWGCGQTFVTRYNDQRYCTDDCKRRRQPQPKKLTLTPISKVNYKAYIASDDWKRRADAAKKRAGHRCQVCNRGADQVLQLEAHHRTYENLGNEQAQDITVLCNECHDLFSAHGKLASY